MAQDLLEETKKNTASVWVAHSGLAEMPEIVDLHHVNLDAQAEADRVVMALADQQLHDLWFVFWATAGVLPYAVSQESDPGARDKAEMRVLDAHTAFVTRLNHLERRR